MSPMTNPPYLGETVLFECIQAAGLTVTEAARLLPACTVARPERPRRRIGPHGVRVRA